MDETTQEDWLDRQLREAAPYIDDDGFTARVLQQLPVPSRSGRSMRNSILLSITVLASVIAYVLSDGARFISDNLMLLATWPVQWLLLLALASGILVTAIGSIAAISKSRELQS